MTGNDELSNELAAAACSLGATACNNALVALRCMSRDPSALSALTRIHQLSEYSRRISDKLEVGEDALQLQETDSANLEWAGALVLMDSMSVYANDAASSTPVKQAVERQKSGKTA